MVQQRKKSNLSPNYLLEKQEIRLEVVFGTPSQNCAGIGICMVINQLPRQSILKCPHATAWVSYEQGQLIFRFPKSGLTMEVANSRLNSIWFCIKEQLKLPIWVITKLNLQTSFITPGLYPIRDTTDDLILTLLLPDFFYSGTFDKVNFTHFHHYMVYENDKIKM